MTEVITEQRVASGEESSRSPLPGRRRLIVVGLSVAIAATRFMALSRSIWDWDEALFCMAVGHYDVATHHPHPPGFPLFIALAKLARMVMGDDFHALRAVATAAAIFAFPAMYGLARAMRFSFSSSIAAGVLFAFLPNVWFWGGTAFSDIPSIVLFIAGAAFLFLDDDRPKPYLIGSVLFAGSLLIRPQNVLLAYPWFRASWSRIRGGRWRTVVGSAALITMLIAVGYGAAAYVTGWDRYVFSTRAHEKYVATVDGALNPGRPPVLAVFRDFAIDPFGGGRASTVLFIFALAAFIRPRRRHWEVLATFLPNFLLAWFWLSVTGVSRLSLGYIPMHALLAADGMLVVAVIATGRLPVVRRDRFVLGLQLLFTLVVSGRYAGWIWEGLEEVRNNDSPPVAAIRWIRAHAPASTARVYVQGGMEPFAAYFLGDYRTEAVKDDVDPATLRVERDAYYIASHTGGTQQAIDFRRPRRRLWSVFHRRYFEACVIPVGGWVSFVDGWYNVEENDLGDVFRWMSGRSRALLQPLGRPAELTLELFAPIDSEKPPVVTVWFDGAVIDHFVPVTAVVRRRYQLQSAGDHPDDLTMAVDRVLNLEHLHKGTDDRNLGLKLISLSWKAR